MSRMSQMSTCLVCHFSEKTCVLGTAFFVRLLPSSPDVNDNHSNTIPFAELFIRLEVRVTAATMTLRVCGFVTESEVCLSDLSVQQSPVYVSDEVSD